MQFKEALATISLTEEKVTTKSKVNLVMTPYTEVQVMTKSMGMTRRLRVMDRCLEMT